jgi:hypothetical protein
MAKRLAKWEPTSIIAGIVFWNFAPIAMAFKYMRWRKMAIW